MYLKDRLPELDVPVTEVVSKPELDAAGRLLMEAAEIIRRKGWTKYTYACNEGYCMLGAVYEAAGAIRRTPTGGIEIMGDQFISPDPRLQEAMFRIGRLHYGPHWNDKIAKTKEEVIEALELCAAVR